MAIYTHTFWGASQGGGKEFEGVLTADLITQEHTHTHTHARAHRLLCLDKWECLFQSPCFNVEP